MATKQHAGHFPSEPSPIISKASCDLLRAFQVCETPLPTAGKSLLPAVIKTDNLTGEKGGGWVRRGGCGGTGVWVEERKESQRKKWLGAFGRLELKQRAFH